MSLNFDINKDNNIYINRVAVKIKKDNTYMNFFVNYNVLYKYYLVVFFLFDVLDKIKECLVIAIMPRKHTILIEKVLLQKWPASITLCPDKENIENK